MKCNLSTSQIQRGGGEGGGGITIGKEGQPMRGLELTISAEGQSEASKKLHGKGTYQYINI